MNLFIYPKQVLFYTMNQLNIAHMQIEFQINKNLIIIIPPPLPHNPRLHQQGLADDGQVCEGRDGRSGRCGRAVRLLKQRHQQAKKKRTLVPSVI